MKYALSDLYSDLYIRIITVMKKLLLEKATVLE